MYIDREKVYSLGTTVISILLMIQAFRYPTESSQFPRFLCILMVVFSLLSMIRAIKGKENEKKLILYSTCKVPVAVFGSAILYVIGISYIGYFVSSIAYLLISMLIFGERRIVPMIVASLVFLAAIYALFVQFLGLRLPIGILF